jgi:hypothetical protein
MYFLCLTTEEQFIELHSKDRERTRKKGKKLEKDRKDKERSLEIKRT